ncbi:MAG: hypothetical protein Q9170_005698 [Blastenia crenularia]
MAIQSSNRKLALFISAFLFTTAVLLQPRFGLWAPGYPSSYDHWDRAASYSEHGDNHDCNTVGVDLSAAPELSKPSLTFTALIESLDTMQSHFYTIWQGQWPTAIDWTAAVMGTHVSATLVAMTEAWYHRAALSSRHDPARENQEWENIINRYFTQITSFYFGENAFSLRTQAYDDMLWVVLGWLESINFINLHSDLHHVPSGKPLDPTTVLLHNSTGWYAQQFIPQFAHRARLFYDLAAKGWDTSLCGGGMVWNPYLKPYKNAITNQLFISASISMYLNFPGDNNPSPFSIENPVQLATGLPPAEAHDPQYLENAVEAYQWLKTSGMTNRKGLYVDGFHIRGWQGGKNGSLGTGKCDIRNEQVYTYNQGVILSGLRGLWQATGSKTYLDDGHQLIQNVIAATGWYSREKKWRWLWSGLGRNGVIEEACDSWGTCSQNGHTFKGIFFHHLTLFCSLLPLAPSTGSSEGDFKTFAADDRLFTWHKKNCEEYGPWLRHNAQAAYVTRDEEGEYGTWWGVPGRDRPFNATDLIDYEDLDPPSNEGTDYRNDGVPLDSIWRLPEDQRWQFLQSRKDEDKAPVVDSETGDRSFSNVTTWDANNRGRGRTVETQSGGLAVMRALWKVIDSKG